MHFGSMFRSGLDYRESPGDVLHAAQHSHALALPAFSSTPYAVDDVETIAQVFPPAGEQCELRGRWCNRSDICTQGGLARADAEFDVIVNYTHQQVQSRGDNGGFGDTTATRLRRYLLEEHVPRALPAWHLFRASQPPSTLVVICDKATYAHPSTAPGGSFSSWPAKIRFLYH